METRVLIDGNDTIIVVNNAKDKIQEIVKSLEDIIGNVKVDEVVGLEPAIEAPVKPLEKEIPVKSSEDIDYKIISKGEYKGLSPVSVLNRYKEKALQKFFNYCNDKEIPKEEKRFIVQCCKIFMFNIKENIKDYNIEEKLSFIKTINDLFNIEETKSVPLTTDNANQIADVICIALVQRAMRKPS